MLGKLLVISGPSGAGKSTLCKAVMESYEDVYFSVSTTTRPMREDDIEGVTYNFVSKGEFEKDISSGYFLEYAKVYDNYYGTSLRPVQNALKEGKLVLFDVDVQGHRSIRSAFYPIMKSIFVTTLHKTSLKKRLHMRGSDSEEVIDERLRFASSEIRCLDEFDYLIVNEDRLDAIRRICNIVETFSSLTTAYELDEFIANWFK